MILDTNGLSAMAEGDAGLEQLLKQAEEIALPVIVLGEFVFGIRQSRNRRQYERWLELLVGNCRVLSVDEGTVEHYAAVREDLKRKGRPIPSNDLWIAALVRQHKLPLLSRDQHFDSVAGLTRVVW